MPNAGKWGLTPAGEQPILADGSVAMRADFNMGGHEVLNPGWVKQLGDIMLGSGVGQHAPLTVGDDGKIIVADSSQTLGVGYRGQLIPLLFHYPNASSATSLNTYSAYPTIGGAYQRRDLPVPWSGEISAAAAWVDVNAYTSGDICYEVWINGVADTEMMQFTPSGVGNGQESYDTGLSIPFSANDKISCRRKLITPVGITTDDVVILLYARVEAP
jgi:hypothetical protein